MQNPDARTLRGVGIAVVILSVISAILFLLGAIVVGAVGAFASDPSLYGNGISSHGYGHGYYDSLSPEGAASLVGLSLGLATAALVWGLLCSIGTLVAGILGMRNHDNPEKLGSAFGWSIAGAVLALLSGRIITMILLIVAAICINKVRNPAANPYAQAYAPQGYAQPMQPQPYGQQPQGYAPQPYQQPAAYQQPTQSTPGQQDPAQPQAPAPQTPPDQQ